MQLRANRFHCALTSRFPLRVRSNDVRPHPASGSKEREEREGGRQRERDRETAPAEHRDFRRPPEHPGYARSRGPVDDSQRQKRRQQSRAHGRSYSLKWRACWIIQ